jgi:hypothetical protein
MHKERKMSGSSFKCQIQRLPQGNWRYCRHSEKQTSGNTPCQKNIRHYNCSDKWDEHRSTLKDTWA